jgi:hypothetical protein
VTISDTTMKLLKWMPVSQLVKKKDLNKRRLFEDESSRNSFGMDEDSNMSNVSNASDSQDGIAQNNVQAQDKEGTILILYRYCWLIDEPAICPIRPFLLSDSRPENVFPANYCCIGIPVIQISGIREISVAEPFDFCEAPVPAPRTKKKFFLFQNFWIF